jgi:neurotransmitter:Na+ symporter, NSS family
MSSSHKEQWGSKIGVVLAVAGSAVGLGNFLRFPGQAAQNGGGAFMIPYFIALLLLGIPLCWAEWSMGRYGGRHGFNSAPGIFSVLWRNPISKYLGAFALLIPLTVYFYYIVIEAWCLGYAWQYLTGSLMNGINPQLYSDKLAAFTGSNADGDLIFGSGQQTLIFVAITFLLNFVLVYRGLSGGIEKFCNIAMPMMAICAVCVLIRVLTLGTPDPKLPEQNVVNGLGFMWNPDLTKLSDYSTWLSAAGQIFFSLSVGFGVIINYASYVKPKEDIALSGVTASSINEFFEVCLGGLITLPAAFVFLGATAMTGYVGSSFGLGFSAMPNVFAVMPGGQVFGFLWFFMLFLAAITSSLSMLQPVNAFFKEGLGYDRGKATGLLLIVSVIGTSFVLYFSKGSKGLDTIDFWAGTFTIVVLALIQAIVYGWILGIEKGQAELDNGAKLRVPRFVQFVIKFVTPTYIIAILFAFLFLPAGKGKPSPFMERIYELATSRVALGSVVLILSCLVMLWVMIYFAGKRWQAEGRYNNLPK